tara:strand:+ start:451 stop:1029 length:579 start_codon:yes stop_codon:yes gene_type:complete
MEKELKNENEGLEETVETIVQIEQPEEAETITANTSEDPAPEPSEEPEPEPEPAPETVEATQEKKPNAFSRWLKAGERIKELQSSVDTLGNELEDKEEALEVLNEKNQATEEALGEATQQINQFAKELEELATVEETVAALGFEAADLPAIQTAEEEMSRTELWEAYQSLSLEAKNEFYQKHRATMATSGLN